MNSRFWVTAIAVLVLLAEVSLGQQRQAAPDPSAMIVRAYNISDLLRVSNDYPLETKAPAQNLFNSNANAPAPVKSPAPDGAPLIATITNLIEPASWNNSEGRINVLGTTLVVRQTSEVQNRVQQLLDNLRVLNGPSQVVTVRATWISCAPRELPDTKTEVTAEWMGKQKVYCESQITCFSGQTVHLTTGKTRQFISDVTPVVAQNAVGYDPTIAKVLSGVELQILAQLWPGSDTVIMDVQTVINDVQPLEAPIPIVSVTTPEGPNASPRPVVANIDRYSVNSQEFKTTARVPLRKKVIIGGMTLEPTGADQPDGRQLYLIVEVDSPK